MKKGFTLAEVLITITIVGLIAILTIPTMVKHYRYKMYAATLKKTYSQLEDAVKQAMADEMTSEFYKTTSGSLGEGTDYYLTGPKYFLHNYFKVVKENCRDCIPEEYYTPTTTNAGMTHNRDVFGYCAKISTGAVLCMINWAFKPEYGGRYYVFLDINGGEPPNMTGVDAYLLEILGDGTVKDMGTSNLCNVHQGSSHHIGDYAPGCFAKVMEDGWVITPVE